MEYGTYQNGESASNVTLSAVDEQANKDRVSRLVGDYDVNIQRLKKQIESYHAEQTSLKRQIESITAENRSLNERLRDALSRQEEFGNDGTAQTGDGVTGNLQQQLAMALQEKDSAMEMWQASVQEVERLEKQLQSARLNPRVQSLEMQAQQIKDQYVRTAAELNQQTIQLQEELKKTKNELKVSNMQVVDLRKMLEDLRSEMLIKEQRRVMDENAWTCLDRRVKELTQQVTDLQSQVVSRSLDIDQLQSEKLAVEERFLDLQRKSTDDETRNAEAISKLRKSFQMAENAVIERDEVLIKQRQAEEEISRLQDALSKIVDEAGARTRQEVDNVKKQCNVNLAKATEEIQRLEVESSEKQAQLERVLREKRAVESELERIYHEGIVQGGRAGNELNDLTQRACNAERARDEALLKVDSMTNQLRRMEVTHKQETSRLEAELELIRDRCSVVNEEFSSANDDRVSLIQKVDQLKQQLHKLEQEKDSAQRAAMKQVARLSQDLQVKEKEYEVKLQSIEDSHRRTALELREMISAQQRLSAKWKEECNSLTQKMEHKMNDARNELKREQRRTEELTRLLRESREKTIEIEAKVQQYGRHIRELESKILEYDPQGTCLTTQTVRTNASATKGLNIIEARRQQQRELELNLKQSLAAISCGSMFDGDSAR